jgi:hypothetical protein
MSRKLLIPVVAGTVILLSAGGVALTGAIKTPDQVAAAAAPPPRSVVTVPVEHRVLSRTTTSWCEPGYDSPEKLTILPEAGDLRQVFTSIHVRENSRIADGDVLLTINDQPRIGIIQKVPFYKDLKLGDEGADVSRLQGFLMRTGFLPAYAMPGRFDAATAVSLAKFYKSRGLEGRNFGNPQTLSDVRALVRTFIAVPTRSTRLVGSVPQVGAPAGNAVLQVSTRPIGLTCSFDSAQLPAGLSTKTAVRIDGGTAPLKGTVAAIHVPTQTKTDAGSDTPQTSSAFVRVEHGKVTTASEPVQATFVLSSTAEKVLVVPDSAVWTRGTSVVVSIEKAGRVKQVPVVSGMSADGFTAVRPVTAGAITAASRVVVTR